MAAKKHHGDEKCCWTTKSRKQTSKRSHSEVVLYILLDLREETNQEIMSQGSNSVLCCMMTILAENIFCKASEATFWTKKSVLFDNRAFVPPQKYINSMLTSV